MKGLCLYSGLHLIAEFKMKLSIHPCSSTFSVTFLTILSKRSGTERIKVGFATRASPSVPYPTLEPELVSVKGEE